MTLASANAYLNALNKMLIKEKKSFYKNIEPQKIKKGVEWEYLIAEKSLEPRYGADLGTAIL